ncbi:MAG: Crp/Fnr family transcriptional regulator [Cyanobacteria bacterium]|jgi:CRP-like cAMP-binding protein|uniref:Crp/Fnr family transcriptional regulator n=1 Tax=Geminocystis sp. TaxID=2664100 RepID=UPI001DC96044|nr:Crp/Fnr family transcriptional regulator [Cyanobacteria bacterium CG_2015-16_32_12]NCO77841.1 Crp/Fnr family transcriptional regulator [Cyanobacteria bacterium CG_2015-22_32_23]NCQ03382.1 Crp/Fnr family transcriptional regulator [Cyanobacteria bacterium CG_2015-09_32_10]NCQ42190.1 Crp/Fnr family transcriptional regulator [Cyanobacteria bacterium CG_2015-04_32_10]NCS84267.1 Crp/Fnr family transcriptional regulator [Cyanobacteria bacterium CG_2015-02_32_10]
MLLSYPSHHLTISPTERRLHFYERGEEIPLVSQGIWEVNRGVVQLLKFNPQGEETLLGWVQSDNFFGLWLTSVDTFQAKTLSDVYLKWYSLEEIDKNPLLAHKILSQIAKRLRQTEELLAIAGLKKVEDRLLKLLKLLAKEIGEKQESFTRIKVRFTHQNLANAIGTTRVTVTRILGDLQKQGLVSLDHTRHLLLH